MANDYLQMMEGLDAGDDARFQASATQAVNVNAEQAAAAKRVAGYLGVPTAAVEAAPEDAQRQARVQKLNDDTADAPTLRRMYGNPDWAKLAHDDSGPLSAMERAVRAYFRGETGLVPSAKAAVGGMVDSMLPREKTFTDAPRVMRSSEFAQRVQEFRQQNPLVDADTARALMGQGVIIDNQSALIGPPEAPKPTPMSIAAGLYNALVQGARATDAGLGRMAADYLNMPEQAAQFARAGQQANSRALLTRPSFEMPAMDWAYGGLESTAQMAPGLAVSILTRNPELATAFTLGQFGVNQTGPAYNKYRDRGATIGQATLASVMEGGIEVGTELLPMKYLTEKFGKVGLGEMVTHFLTRDMIGEQLATLGQDAVDAAVANPDMTLGQYLAERPEAAGRTLVATLVQFGAIAGGNSAARRTFMRVEAELEKARTADEQTKALTEILQIAAGSKLRERDPSSFADFVHETTKDGQGDGNVYVDASTLSQVLAQSGVTLDQLHELSPTAATQLPDAVSLNGTVAIPVGDLVGRIASTDLEQQLLPHLRPTEDGLSQEEAKLVTAQAQQFLEQASQRVVEQAADAAVVQLSQSKVKTTIVDQLNAANRFTKDVNEAYGTLVSSFYTAVAHRFGLTPEEMYARYPLRVQAARPAVEQGGQLSQAAYHGSPHDFDKFSTDHIGTGEGAQAYGHGLYFAESPSVAKQYAENVKNMAAVQRINAEMSELAKTMATDEVPGTHRQYRSDAGKQAAARYDELMAERDRVRTATGKVYQVEIPDHAVSKMLLWDKPLSEQPASVQEALAKAFPDHYSPESSDYDAAERGDSIYQRIAQMMAGRREEPQPAGVPRGWGGFVQTVNDKVVNQRAASQALHAAGIPGIKYLDGQSRNRPLKEIKREFLEQLPEDADFNEVLDLIGTGTFSPANEAILKALAANDWLGFDHPAQAISAALSPDLSQYDASPELVKAVADAQAGATHNLVVFNDKNVQLTHKDGSPVTQAEHDQFFQNSANIPEQGAPNGQADAGDGTGRPASGSTAPLEGAPHVAGATGPDARIVAVAEQYARDHGLPFGRQAEYAPVDPERAARVAAAYDAMPHAPQDPAVKAAYADLIQQTIAQYRALEAAGYKFWLFDESNDPYAGNPWNAMRDLRGNQQMGVFATEAGFGSGATELNTDDNPLLADTGITWPYGGLDGEPKRVLANDLFRAVHDAMGHGLEGAGFRAQGEENAWQAHLRLYTGPAVGAMTSETRGQNSWLNFGPQGETNRTAKVEDTVFADQKTGLMPEWTWSEGRVPDENLQQGPRGSFSPSSLSITLLEKADLSTFLHETGHFFLEALGDMAAQQDAPADIQKDMLTVLEWFGVRTLGEWNAMSLDEQRAHHEKFAESFEQYLFEGKAPSRELGSLFGRFRAWLTNVYRSLQTFMASYNTNLSDEVRHVFDRLLATQEQIEQAEEDNGFASMLQQFEGKVDPVLLEHYKRLTSEATEDAMARLQSRSLRDLKWVVNARSRELKRLSKDVADKREAVQKEVTAEVDAAPEMQAAARLEEIMRATPEVKDARKDWRDRRAAALERAREEMKAKYNADADAQELKGLQKGQYLSKNRKAIEHEVNGKMIEWEREHPFPARPPMDDIPLDAIAEQYGFTSGDHMLQAIDAFGSREHAIEGITNQRMLERYGDLITPEGVKRAANEAVHNEARARAVAAELQALQDSVTAKAPTGKTITANTKTGRVQYQQTTNVIVEAARRFAANLVARQKVRELRASQHQAAERRAGKLAMEAASKGKTDEAMAAKRDQLLNFYAAKETLAASDEIDKGLKFLRKVADSQTLDPAYAEQIATMLERFDLRPASNKALERRATLLEWVDSQRAIGIEPDIPPGLMDEAVRKNYRDMTVEEFRGLVDTVKQIEHLGRLKHKLLTAKDEREFAAVVDAIAQRIIASAGQRTVENVTPNTELGKKLQGLQKFAAQHVKAATWARIMDGGKDGGPVWEYIIRAANEAGNGEVEMRANATRDLTELVGLLLEGGKMSAKTFIPEINDSLNRQARLAVALNMGNESNRQRLMGGHGWTEAQLNAIGKTLTEQEWRFVQKVWDYFETYRPLIGAKEKRVTGVEPKWIEHAPFEVQSADGKDVKLRGGYYPVKYDPEASHRAEQHADAEAAKQQMRGAYTSATTRRSFTKARADEVSGRPLLLSLDGIYQGINEVIHDLSWHEFLIDANRLVGNDKIAAAMRQKFGSGSHQQFKSWLQDVARGETNVVGEGFAGFLRSGVSISGLGFNIMSAAIQPLGITQSITRIGAKWVGRGVARYAGAPIETTDFTNEKSSFMRHRAQTRLRELAEVAAKIQGRSKVREGVDVAAYYLMLKAQQTVDVPTWVGAYEKATVEGGFDEARAVQLADQAVIDAQGSGMLKDQAAIERGGQMKKLLTVFYSFFNTTLNNLVLQTSTHTSKAKLAADYLLLAVVPVVLGAVLRDAMTPGNSGDWEDPKKMAKRLAGEEISYLMGLMVGVREFTNAAQAVTGTAKYGTDYAGPAGVRMVGDVTKLGAQVQQAHLDPAFRKAVVNVAGELLRLPGAQMNRSISGYEALRDGKTHNPLALVAGYQEPAH